MDYAWIRREEKLVQARNTSRLSFQLSQIRVRDQRHRLAVLQQLNAEGISSDPDGPARTALVHLEEAMERARSKLAPARRALYWYRNAHAFLVLRVLQSRYWSALPDAICREIVRFL